MVVVLGGREKKDRIGVLVFSAGVQTRPTEGEIQGSVCIFSQQF